MMPPLRREKETTMNINGNRRTAASRAESPFVNWKKRGMKYTGMNSGAALIEAKRNTSRRVRCLKYCIGRRRVSVVVATVQACWIPNKIMRVTEITRRTMIVADFLHRVSQLTYIKLDHDRAVTHQAKRDPPKERPVTPQQNAPMVRIAPTNGQYQQSHYTSNRSMQTKIQPNNLIFHFPLWLGINRWQHGEVDWNEHRSSNEVDTIAISKPPKSMCMP
jgi:hypothetical protein